MGKQKTPRERTALEERISAKQAENRAARQAKITPEDVERRLAERRARRVAKAEARPAGRGARYVSLGLGFAMLIGTGAIAVTTSNGTQSFSAQLAADESRIAGLEGDLAAVPASSKTGAATYTRDLTKQLAAARKKGDEVASLQQRFQEILVAANDERSNDGAATPAEKDAAEHRKALAPYFVDRALIVKDTAAYAPGSVLPFDDDEIDPRFPWHVSYRAGGTTANDPSMSRWALTSMIATDTPGVFAATWLDRRTADSDLLAWATASYYVSERKFGSVRLGETTLGATGSLGGAKAGN